VKERIKTLTFIIGVGYIILATVTSHGAQTAATYQPSHHPLAKGTW